MENVFRLSGRHGGAEIDPTNSPQQCLSPGSRALENVLERALAERSEL